MDKELKRIRRKLRAERGPEREAFSRLVARVRENDNDAQLVWTELYPYTIDWMTATNHAAHLPD